jgi:hypothetical protein
LLNVVLVLIEPATVLLYCVLPFSLLLPQLAQSPLPASNLDIKDETMVEYNGMNNSDAVKSV